MAILKLQNEGETYTGTLTSCQSVQGQYGEQVEFIFVGGDKLFLPKDSADRQLDRLGLDYESANGMALTFSRDHNPKKGAKPYWGIAFAKEGKPATPQAAGPTRVQSPYVPPRETAPPRGVSAGPRIPDMDGPSPTERERIEDSWCEVFERGEGHRCRVQCEVCKVAPYAEPPLTPREEREANEAGGVDFAKINKRAAFLRFYAETYKTLALALVTDARVPLTAEAVQAATATCIIQMDRKGLLP